MSRIDPEINLGGQKISAKECKKRVVAKEQIDLLKNTFHDAKEYGSILDVKGIDFDFWEERLTFIRNLAQQQNNTPKIKGRLPYTLKQARIMQQKYECVIANPPYLSRSGFNLSLTKYVDKHFPTANTDLGFCFIEAARKYSVLNSYYALITMQSWMTGKTNTEFRKQLLNNSDIISMLHLGSRAFDTITGEVVQTTTFILRNTSYNEASIFCNLTLYKSELLKRDTFLEIKEQKKYTIKTNKNLKNNPDYQIIYDDLSSKLLGNSAETIPLKEIANCCTGMQTGSNDKYIRYWQEVNYYKTVLNNSKTPKWYKYNCGGKSCKWYGNHTHLVLWEYEGSAIRHEKSSVIRNSKNFFKEGISWKRIGSNFFRYLPEGFIFDQAGDSMFINEKNNLFYVLGLINTKVISNCLNAISPTNNLTAGTMNLLPIIITEKTDKKNKIDSLVEKNIQISKDDWDSFETSWDFEQHPLLRFKENGKVEDSFSKWKEYKQEQFNKLKANEEELNRLFIDIYGLQDEMTPEVDNKDITVALADELRDIKSLLSYAVGCMFGRYSLDKKGLIFAGGEFNKDNYKTFEADDDAIIPILSEHYFSDDITERFKNFIKIAFGDKYYEENLEYIASVLGKKSNGTVDATIRNYFSKDFYNDHVKMYQKRPIYWLFSSKNSNFNVLIYLHRYNKDTVNRILNNYLREYRGKLEQSIHNDKQLLTSSASDRDKSKAQKEIETAQKIVNEVTDYERDILYPLATERKEIDLDDGVKVNYLKFGKALKDIGLKAKK